MMAGIHRERGENLPGLGDSFEVDSSPAKQSFVSDVTASFFVGIIVLGGGGGGVGIDASGFARATYRSRTCKLLIMDEIRSRSSLHDEAAEEELFAGSSVSSREEDGQDVLF